MANVRRLAELGMATELAKEVAAQIESGDGAVPTFSELPGSVPDADGDNLQEILEDLAARIEALENA